MTNYKYAIVHSTSHDEFIEIYDHFAKANIDAHDMWKKLSDREQHDDHIMVVKVPKSALRLIDIEELGLTLNNAKAWRYFDWDLVESYDRYFDSDNIF